MGWVVHADGFPHIDKAPDARLKYRINLTAWLAIDAQTSFLTATATADTGLTVDGGVEIADGVLGVILKDGTAGQSYRVLLEFTTAPDGYVDSRTFVIDVKER